MFPIISFSECLQLQPSLEFFFKNIKLQASSIFKSKVRVYSFGDKKIDKTLKLLKESNIEIYIDRRVQNIHQFQEGNIHHISFPTLSIKTWNANEISKVLEQIYLYEKYKSASFNNEKMDWLSKIFTFKKIKHEIYQVKTGENRLRIFPEKNSKNHFNRLAYFAQSKYQTSIEAGFSDLTEALFDPLKNEITSTFSDFGNYFDFNNSQRALFTLFHEIRHAKFAHENSSIFSGYLKNILLPDHAYDRFLSFEEIYNYTENIHQLLNLKHHRSQDFKSIDMHINILSHIIEKIQKDLSFLEKNKSIYMPYKSHNNKFYLQKKMTKENSTNIVLKLPEAQNADQVLNSLKHILDKSQKVLNNITSFWNRVESDRVKKAKEEIRKLYLYLKQHR